MKKKKEKSVNKILAVTFAPMMCECEHIWMSRNVLNDDDGSVEVSNQALKFQIQFL